MYKNIKSYLTNTFKPTRVSKLTKYDICVYNITHTCIILNVAECSGRVDVVDTATCSCSWRSLPTSRRRSRSNAFTSMTA